jgi:two-component system, NarL family, sensor kinase
MHYLAASGMTIVISVFVGLLLLFTSFIVLIIYQYQKYRQQYLQSFQQLKLGYEATLLQSQVEIQEQTLSHIAKEIHDNIGQQLTLAKLYLNTQLMEEPSPLLHSTVEILSGAIQELSSLSRSMGSQLLLDNGLISAVAEELKKLDTTKQYQTQLNITGEDVLLHANTELLLFRIVQEAINNIVKHAKANYITVALHYKTAKLTLQIGDNGCGFDTSQTYNGAGLRNIQLRTQMLAGTCNILSEPGNTFITIQIPLNQPQND